MANAGPASALDAGLCYVTDGQPGLRRLRCGAGFVYRDRRGRRILDRGQLQRIRALVIPPAWRDVWICVDPRGHLQATGRDSRGRKQYRYHPDWRAIRDQSKFDRLTDFGRVLPRIRRRVRHDLALPGLPRVKVVAAVIRLLQTTLARVGNEEYARINHSFGLTTLRDHHVRVKARSVEFCFAGKGGKRHHLRIDDARMASIVRKCRDLPGYELFQYLDEKGQRHSVGSSDVNQYLQGLTGQEFTAKDFRTWAGTLLALEALHARSAFASKAEAQRNLTAVVRQVAGRLGNTAAICRKCYIHPAVLESYLTGRLPPLQTGDNGRTLSGLTRTEASLVLFLESWHPVPARAAG